MICSWTQHGDDDIVENHVVEAPMLLIITCLVYIYIYIYIYILLIILIIIISIGN